MNNECLLIDIMSKFILKLSEEAGGGQGNRKRRRLNLMDDDDADCAVTTVTNSNPSNYWTLKGNEKFQTFASAKSKPKNICLSFWMKNKCNSDCPLKHSHLTRLNNKDGKAMSAFVKSMRAKDVNASDA